MYRIHNMIQEMQLSEVICYDAVDEMTINSSQGICTPFEAIDNEITDVSGNNRKDERLCPIIASILE